MKSAAIPRRIGRANGVAKKMVQKWARMGLVAGSLTGNQVKMYGMQWSVMGPHGGSAPANLKSTRPVRMSPEEIPVEIRAA
jgi:hypothetical protein